MEKIGLGEIVYGLIVRPGETFRRLVEEQPLLSSLLFYALVALVSTLTGSVLLFNRPETLFLPGMPPPSSAEISQFIRPMAVVMGILGVPWALIGLLIQTGIFHGLARLLGGKGSFRGLLTCLGFTSLINLFTTLVNLLVLLLGSWPLTILRFIVVPALGLWQLVLRVMAIRQSHYLNWGRAIAVVLIPPALLFVLVLFMVIILLLFLIPIISQGLSS